MMQRCGRTFSVEPTAESAGTDVDAPDETARSNRPDRATRRAEEEGGDTLFVPEGRQSRRAARRDPRPRCSRRRSAGGADERAEKELVHPTHRFVGSDEDGGSSANIAASGASNSTQRAWRVRQLDRTGKGQLISASRVTCHGRHLEVVSIAEDVVAVQAHAAQIADALFITTCGVDRLGGGFW